jgi:hypothetical protein
MSEGDDLFASVEAFLDALRREILVRLDDRHDHRLPDVPLHQRGFGVMDEPTA